MNYDRYAEDPLNSPLLNGNASSIGGNGVSDPTYKGVPQQGRKPNIIATGGRWRRLRDVRSLLRVRQLPCIPSDIQVR